MMFGGMARWDWPTPQRVRKGTPGQSDTLGCAQRGCEPRGAREIADFANAAIDQELAVKITRCPANVD
jgi:hypothetical protein